MVTKPPTATLSYEVNLGSFEVVIDGLSKQESIEYTYSVASRISKELLSRTPILFRLLYSIDFDIGDISEGSWKIEIKIKASRRKKGRNTRATAKGVLYGIIASVGTGLGFVADVGSVLDMLRNDAGPIVEQNLENERNNPSSPEIKQYRYDGPIF